MKKTISKILLCSLFFNLSIVITSTAQTQTKVNAANNLTFLKKLNGKYPSTVDLLKHPQLKNRLVKMLKKDMYKYLSNIWEVETPIKVEGDYFYAQAMQRHSGGDPSAVILANIKTNKVYVRLYADQIYSYYAENSKIELHAEAKDEIPAELLEWADKQ